MPYTNESYLMYTVLLSLPHTHTHSLQIDSILHMDFQLEAHTNSSLPASSPPEIDEYLINGIYQSLYNGL